MPVIPTMLSWIKPVIRELAIFLLLLNIFLPGLGTTINQCMGEGPFLWRGWLVGLAQAILAPLFLFGWLWSVWWGIEIMRKSKDS